MISLDLGQSAPGGVGPDRFVPAAVSWSQILDYAAGADDGDWPFELYAAGVGGAVVRYAALYRVLTLISGTIAQLVCAPGSLRVIDRDGRRVRSDRVVDLLAASPDGGETPASHLIEDTVADYLVRGTAYLAARRGVAGVSRLDRMLSGDRSVYHGHEGGAMLRLRRLDGTTEAVARRDVAVVRWPRLIATDRIEGASPLTALRPALDIGIQGDRYIREWFRSGAKSRLHLDYDPQIARTDKQRNEIRESVDLYTRSRTRQPLVTFGGASNSISDTPQDRAASMLREFQVREIGRVYGVPAPLLGEQVTEWGKGIEQLARLFWRFGARTHLDRLLLPLSHLLLPPGHCLACDHHELIAGDTEALRGLLVALQGDAQRDPIATREELRRLAGLPREDREDEDEPPAAGPPGPPATSPPNRGALPPPPPRP